MIRLNSQCEAKLVTPQCSVSLPVDPSVFETIAVRVLLTTSCCVCVLAIDARVVSFFPSRKQQTPEHRQWSTTTNENFVSQRAEPKSRARVWSGFASLGKSFVVNSAPDVKHQKVFQVSFLPSVLFNSRSGPSPSHHQEHGSASSGRAPSHHG